MNPTYEMSGAGSEHADKRQRQRLTNQLPIPHAETKSHDAAMPTSLVWIVPGVKARSTGSPRPPASWSATSAIISRFPSVAGLIEQAPEYQYEEPWIRAAYWTERWLTLTPERLDELSERIEDLVREYYDSPTTDNPSPRRLG